MESQTIPSVEILQLVSDLHGQCSPGTLEELRNRMFRALDSRPITGSDDEIRERQIRWKRTATEILNDGYVYAGKSCTDLSILFMSLCRALKLKTVFVKLTKEHKTHSVVEVYLPDGWYIFDVSRPDTTPVKGEITAATPYNGWTVWKKGADAWSLGLESVENIASIFTP